MSHIGDGRFRKIVRYPNPDFVKQKTAGGIKVSGVKLAWIAQAQRLVGWIEVKGANWPCDWDRWGKHRDDPKLDLVFYTRHQGKLE